jgi:hypothetical protein
MMGGQYLEKERNSTFPRLEQLAAAWRPRGAASQGPAMGDEEGPPPYAVQLTVSFALVEREPPPAPPAPAAEGEEGAEDGADGAEPPPPIDNVCFSFSMGEPFAQECKSEPLSVAFPVAEEEGGEVPPMPNWAEQVSWTQTEGLLFETNQAMAQPALLAECCSVAVLNADDDAQLDGTALDLTPMLLGQKTFNRDFLIERIGLVRMSVALDKLWLSPELIAKLLPMSITIGSLSDMPREPHPFKRLSAAFEPVRCEYKLLGEQPLISTPGLPHAKKLAFNSTTVFLAGEHADPAEVREAIEAGLRVKVHDRDFMAPVPVAEPPAAEEGEAAEEGDAEAEGGDEEGEPAAPPEPQMAAYWKHCGEVCVKLDDLLTSPGLVEDAKSTDAHIVKSRSNLIMAINRELPETATPPLAAVPKYMESLTSLSASCAVGFPMSVLGGAGAAPERTFVGPFGRAVYLLKYKNPEFFKKLFGAIREINRTALDLPADHKLNVMLSEPDSEEEIATKKAAFMEQKRAAVEEAEGEWNDDAAEAEFAAVLKNEAAAQLRLPVLTGFQVLDATRRMVFLEGPQEVMALLASKVPRGQANSESFKVFANPNIGFAQRLYTDFELRIPTVRTSEKLDSLMLRPEVAMVSNVEEEDELDQPPATGSGLLRVSVARCMGEISREGGGEPEPFVKLALGEATARTTVTPEDRDAPVWDQVIDLSVDLEKPVPLRLELIDFDEKVAEDSSPEQGLAAGAVDICEFVPGWTELTAADEATALETAEDGTRIATLVGSDGKAVQVVLSFEYSGDGNAAPTPTEATAKSSAAPTAAGGPKAPVGPTCAEGLRRLWAVRRCDYLREIARMGLWPSFQHIGAVNRSYGAKVGYEDVHGEPKPKKKKVGGALEALAAQESEEDLGDGKWSDGHYQKPTQSWKKWRKLTERTTQLDVGDAQNDYYQQMLEVRPQVPVPDFNASYKDTVNSLSATSKSLKPVTEYSSDQIPKDSIVAVTVPPGLEPGQSFQIHANAQLVNVKVPEGLKPGDEFEATVPAALYIYSSQTLNVAELQKEVIRRKLDKPENNDKFYTYSDEYMSLAMCRVNEEEIARQEEQEKQSRWVDPKGWVYPAPKHPREYPVHKKQLHPAAREELMEPWVENVLRPKPVSRDGDLPEGKREWEVMAKPGGTFEKDPQFFTSVFAPAALGLTPEEAEELLQQERKAAEVEWKDKLVVDDPTFRGYFRGTMRTKVHPLERNETMLKAPPNRPQFTDHGKYGKKGNNAIRQAPISMLAGEPYDDPRDFTLDLKKNEPEHNVVQDSTFDRYSVRSSPCLPACLPASQPACLPACVSRACGTRVPSRFLTDPRFLRPVVLPAAAVLYRVSTCRPA